MKPKLHDKEYVTRKKKNVAKDYLFYLNYVIQESAFYIYFGNIVVSLKIFGLLSSLGTSDIEIKDWIKNKGFHLFCGFKHVACPASQGDAQVSE